MIMNLLNFCKVFINSRRQLVVYEQIKESANRLVENSEAEGRSLMYIRNSKGPSEEPCGTPQVTFNKFDSQLAILVY